MESLEDNTNTGENLPYLEYNHAFLDTTLKRQFMEKIIDRLDLVKMKNLLCERQYQKSEKSSHSL